MAKYVINGGRTLSGKVKVSGAKNSALKLIAASILADSETTLRNVPRIEDVNTMIEVLQKLNAKVNFDRENNVLKINPASIDTYETPYELVRKMRVVQFLLNLGD
jgi:UDP-N-acetylglucosamine 1-carboxyvinyltransferase